eukprot:3323318-Pyramimonas_sp.AAC.2
MKRRPQGPKACALCHRNETGETRGDYTNLLGAVSGHTRAAPANHNEVLSRRRDAKTDRSTARDYVDAGLRNATLAKKREVEY